MRDIRNRLRLRTASFRYWLRRHAKSFAWLSWAGAIVAFSFNTYFSYVTVRDARAATEAAEKSADTSAQSVAVQRDEAEATKRAADASAQTIALQRTPTLLISCSGTITEIPNTPTPQLLYISDDPRYVGRKSVTEGLAPTLPFKILPSAITKCRLYNYGSIPIVNGHLNYHVQFFSKSPPKVLKFKFHPYMDVPSENKYDVFIPAIPANSSIVFEILNFSYQRAAAVRQPFMSTKRHRILLNRHTRSMKINSIM
jgi:hypothetical protein